MQGFIGSSILILLSPTLELNAKPNFKLQFTDGPLLRPECHHFYIGTLCTMCLILPKQLN